MRNTIRLLIVRAAITLSLISIAHAEIELSPLVSSGMVLQREVSLPIQGKATAGSSLNLRIADQEHEVRVDDSGNWRVVIEPLNAGGPYELTIKTPKSEHSIADVWVGDVWVTSGQSNMELTMARLDERYAKIMAHCENDQIRMFTVPMQHDFSQPMEAVAGGSWLASHPDTIRSFSGVGYFFAREIHLRTGVPVGIIAASVGGAPIEAFMSLETLKDYPVSFEQNLRFRDAAYVESIEARNQEIQNSWHGTLEQKDRGLNEVPRWSDPAFTAEGWSSFNVPGFWNEQGIPPMHGSVWFRRVVELPEHLEGKAARLYLGTIVDSDIAWVNGVQVGRTYYQYPPRRYEIPEDVLRAGRNVITIRVVSDGNPGGFWPDKPYHLQIGNNRLDLKGPWQYAVGAEMERIGSTVFVRWQPGGLYNGMIAPLHGFPVKGVLWYQGESNTGAPHDYAERLERVVDDWRSGWQQPHMPFITVQLANFMEAVAEPVESNWAVLRDQQRQAMAIPHSGMAVIIDLGEWNDIHPLNKSEVGRRLALEARRIAYGETGLSSPGPLVKSAERKDNLAVIHFHERTTPLRVREGGSLKGFEVAGPDKRFFMAQATVQGNSVILSHPSVDHPFAVRYAWADNPIEANLINPDGLPASPFEVWLQAE